MNKDLSPSEAVIMKAIWEQKTDVAIPELLNILKDEYGKEYARTTVVTFLLSIANKGYVDTYRKGRLSFAHPLKTKEEYRRDVILRDLDMWFDGDVDAMLDTLRSAGREA